ncbi:MAG: tyrosine--tRNA ligase [Anaerolineales bacterium]
MNPTAMTIEEQVTYLMQGTEYGDAQIKHNMAEELRQRLILAQKQNRPLEVYCGFDPRTSDLHLGHTVPMRKMRQFQELGHNVTFVVGSYTALVGDPSDKDKLRPRLTVDEVEHNARTYAEQAFKILEEGKTTIRHNGEWLAGLTLIDLIQLGANFTLQQFINNRENFKLRWEKGDPIYLHETFYGMMQGYDAYTLRADVQIGGTDQMFNIMHASRKVMEGLGILPNIAIIVDILPGTDGEVKMSKSLGNHIPLLSTPENMYGKVMSVPDIAMPKYFELLTRWTPEEIAARKAALASGELHPRDAKMELAREIVSIYQGDAAAQKAQDHFVTVFQKGDLPDDMPEYTLQAGQTVLEVLKSAGLVSSNSEARRLLDQNGVRLDGETLKDGNAPFPGAGVLQAGKRRFVRVVVK